MRLEISDLSAWYGQARALHGVSLQVDAGEVVGVMGRNGAGKTTLLRAIAGLHPKLEGRIAVEPASASASASAPAVDATPPGRSPPGSRRTDRLAHAGIALVREGARLPSSLSVTDVIGLGQALARAKGLPERSLEDIWQVFPILEPLAGRKAGLLSGGQRQALALANAFASQPRILLLDEPSAGLAPPVAHALFRTIATLAAQGLSVLVVEQYPAWLRDCADRAYLLEVGRVIAQGPVDSLAASQARDAA